MHVNGLTHAAVLEFFSRSAWTGVITARDNGLYDLILPVPYPGHDICRRTLVFKLFCHKFHIGFDVPEEQLITIAQIIQSWLSIRCVQKPVFWTFSVTEIPEVAFKAIPGQLIPLVNTKVKLSL